MGHYASEIGYTAGDEARPLPKESMMRETTNGAPKAPDCPNPVKKLKAAQATLLRTLEDTQSIAKAWDTASPAARDLFLKLIGAEVKKE